MSGEFWLTDRQWQRLSPLLPNKPRGVPRVDDRRVISGIIHVLRTHPVMAAVDVQAAAVAGV